MLAINPRAVVAALVTLAVLAAVMVLGWDTVAVFWHDVVQADTWLLDTINQAFRTVADILTSK